MHVVNEIIRQVIKFLPVIMLVCLMYFYLPELINMPVNKLLLTVSVFNLWAIYAATYR